MHNFSPIFYRRMQIICSKFRHLESNLYAHYICVSRNLPRKWPFRNIGIIYRNYLSLLFYTSRSALYIFMASTYRGSNRVGVLWYHRQHHDRTWQWAPPARRLGVPFWRIRPFRRVVHWGPCHATQTTHGIVLTWVPEQPELHARNNWRCLQ
jgi:hypothetical protein